MSVPNDDLLAHGEPKLAAARDLALATLESSGLTFVLFVMSEKTGSASWTRNVGLESELTLHLERVAVLRLRQKL